VTGDKENKFCKKNSDRSPSFKGLRCDFEGLKKV
jgi:hypothetical protein